MSCKLNDRTLSYCSAAAQVACDIYEKKLTAVGQNDEKPSAASRQSMLAISIKLPHRKTDEVEANEKELNWSSKDIFIASSRGN
jgi:hypothetical protein